MIPLPLFSAVISQLLFLLPYKPATEQGLVEGVSSGPAHDAYAAHHSSTSPELRHSHQHQSKEIRHLKLFSSRPSFGKHFSQIIELLDPPPFKLYKFSY